MIGSHDVLDEWKSEITNGEEKLLNVMLLLGIREARE